jgi:hypothetical protein
MYTRRGICCSVSGLGQLPQFRKIGASCEQAPRKCPFGVERQSTSLNRLGLPRDRARAVDRTWDSTLALRHLGFLMAPEKYGGGQGSDHAEDQQSNAKRSGYLKHRGSSTYPPMPNTHAQVTAPAALKNKKRGQGIRLAPASRAANVRNKATNRTSQLGGIAPGCLCATQRETSTTSASPRLRPFLHAKTRPAKTRPTIASPYSFLVIFSA